MLGRQRPAIRLYFLQFTAHDAIRYIRALLCSQSDTAESEAREREGDSIRCKGMTAMQAVPCLLTNEGTGNASFVHESYFDLRSSLKLTSDVSQAFRFKMVGLASHARRTRRW